MRSRGRTPRAFAASALVATFAVATFVLSSRVGRVSLDGAVRDAALLEAVEALRTARWAAAFVAGAALACAGVVVQGLFRNPLASPSVLGTTAGAAFAGQAALALPTLLGIPLRSDVGEVVYPIACVLGALGSLGFLLLFARRGAGRVALLLIGFVLTSLLGAAGSLLLVAAQERFELGRAVVAYALGGVGGTSLERVLSLGPLVAAGLLAAMAWAPTLDVLLSGEDEAASLGVDVRSARRWLVTWTAVLSGTAVALGGQVAFVGLLVPHAVRLLLGARHRALLVVASVAGGTFLVGCDLVARLVPLRSELPLGVVTGVLGAPVFLALLWREREHLDA
jgi:iron complex transport system permease protein